MKRILICGFTVILAFSQSSWAKERFGKKLCNMSKDYVCHTVKRGESWERLFADDEKRDIVRRINRTNVRLRSGMVIAIPKRLADLTIYDVAPFPRYINPTGEKVIYVNQKQLAWAAYDGDGELVWWGPISSGADSCRGVRGKCHTPSGSYRIVRKQGYGCVSSAFPRRRSGNHGGAPMPYCMHFYRGYALHGAPVVPGYRASHGCVRLFPEDARWLNQEFIDVPYAGDKGTRVVVGPVE